MTRVNVDHEYDSREQTADVTLLLHAGLLCLKSRMLNHCCYQAEYLTNSQLCDSVHE
jgi:hypothetical protein